MRPWAKWLINHRMRWLLYVLCILALPVYIARELPDVWETIRSELAAIAAEIGKEQPK